MAYDQLDDAAYAAMWRHRARVAETELATRVPFWLARGRLRARRHTWFHRDGTAVPGYALLDNQGRLRGHLTINQAQQLHKHLGRLLSQEPSTTTEGINQ
jgi:hypothetical protein